MDGERDEPRVRAGRSNLWKLTDSETAGGVLARVQQIGSDRRRRQGQLSAERLFHGHPAASESRWFATTPAHPLAVVVQKRINPEAFLQGGRPPQSPRLPEPFLPQQCEHRIVCLALHAR